jgi:hypothetical protein
VRLKLIEELATIVPVSEMGSVSVMEKAFPMPPVDAPIPKPRIGSAFPLMLLTETVEVPRLP